MSLLPLEQEIDYPTSDGQPMAETPQHMQVMVDLIFGLKRRYQEVSDVWVGGNLFFFYEKGNPKAKVAPDVLLAQGVRKWDRPNYKIWEEGPPALVIEVTSKKTQHKDQQVKKPLYQRLGIKEFVLFDPFGEYLRPPLQGFRLLRGRYQPIPLEADGSLRSRTTGLWLQREGQRLRLVDVATGERLLWDEEESAARKVAEAARQAEAAARQAAEARAAEEAAARRIAEEKLRALEAELKRLRKV
jgi:Uma2 family endonuclease